MKINDALDKIRKELATAGVSSSVSVELSLVFHTDSKGGIEMECVHSRSRRAEHVHKLKFEVAAKSKKNKKIEPPALPEEAKRQIKSAEPKTRTYVKPAQSNYLPRFNPKDAKL